MIKREVCLQGHFEFERQVFGRSRCEMVLMVWRGRLLRDSEDGSLLIRQFSCLIGAEAVTHWWICACHVGGLGSSFRTKRKNKTITTTTTTPTVVLVCSVQFLLQGQSSTVCQSSAPESLRFSQRGQNWFTQTLPVFLRLRSRVVSGGKADFYHLWLRYACLAALSWVIN